jgi:hypothetical protein
MLFFNKNYQFIIRLMVILFLKVHNLCVDCAVPPKAGPLPNSECQPTSYSKPNPIKWSLEDNSKPIGTKSSTEKQLKMIIFCKVIIFGVSFQLHYKMS